MLNITFSTSFLRGWVISNDKLYKVPKVNMTFWNLHALSIVICEIIYFMVINIQWLMCNLADTLAGPKFLDTCYIQNVWTQDNASSYLKFEIYILRDNMAYQSIN